MMLSRTRAPAAIRSQPVVHQTVRRPAFQGVQRPTSAAPLRLLSSESARPLSSLTPPITHPLHIPPAPPSASDILAPGKKVQPQPLQSAAPSAPLSSSEPDPWVATRTTLQAFWSRYGNYVKAYLVWSIVGSLALNVLWTRQEREEFEDAAMVKIRKLERELKSIEDELAVKGSADSQAHDSKPLTKQDGPMATWYLPWTWFASPPVVSSNSNLPSPPQAVGAPIDSGTVTIGEQSASGEAMAAKTKPPSQSSAVPASVSSGEQLPALYGTVTAPPRRARPSTTLY